MIIMAFKKKKTTEEEMEGLQGDAEPQEPVVKKDPSEMTLEDLPGIGPKGAQKLKEAGYTELISVAAASAGEISAACGISDGTAEKIICLTWDSRQLLICRRDGRK